MDQENHASEIKRDEKTKQKENENELFQIALEIIPLPIPTLKVDRTIYLIQLPVSHCVPLNPGEQVQLNAFTRSVQVPLFLQG